MDNSQQLAQVNSDVLRNTSESALTVGQLEAFLLEKFPAEDAESWDNTGLLVGDADASVEGVAVALDATRDAIGIACECSCNVLVTHHPAYLEAPLRITPFGAQNSGPGTVVWEAVKNGIALMCFHTALDVSPAATRVLPSMLGLEFDTVVDVVDPAGPKGYGQLCHMPEAEKGLTLKQLAARCQSVFGRTPRVYGDETKVLDTVVTCTGSAADLPALCLARQYSCLVCGEVKYHAALEASLAGLAIVELGHDVSELPLCAVLAQAVGSAGVDEARVRIIDQGRRWWTPEATRF